MPVLIGSNRDEGRTFAQGFIGSSEADYDSFVTSSFGARAPTVPAYAYEFDHRTGPGLTPIPGYVWGAGHAAELACLFPSFDNGTPIAPTFNAAERRPARDMKAAWAGWDSPHSGLDHRKAA